MWYINPERAEITRVVTLGLVVGVFSPFLSWIVTNLLVRPIFCHGNSCSGDVWGYYVSAIAVSIVATAVMAAQNLYRPLLVSLGAILALWGVGGYLSGLEQSNWLQYYSLSALLYGLSYLLFYWILRLRHFGMSLAVLISVVLLIRWVAVA